MEDLYDPEEKIFCPYNPSHHIRRSRMSFHLVKCKKNYAAQKMVPCDFNVTHLIPEPELRYHHQSCPDRKKVEAQIIEATTSSSEIRFPIAKLDYDPGESWDDENVPTYDPQKYTENRDILRQLDVESGAKRKNFRLSERQRLSGMVKSNSEPQVKPPTMDKIVLPTHRTITNLDNLETTKDPVSVQQKVKLSSSKVYLQFRKGEKGE